MPQFYYGDVLGDYSTLENMDKELIMKLDDEKDLLKPKLPVKGLAYHPIPFPTYRTFLVKPEALRPLVQEHIAEYKDRNFVITCDNYGVEVSVNYEGGKFVSMILKGTGEMGERVDDQVALMLMPLESKNKKNVTLHALLTIVEPATFRGGINNHEVPRILKEALLKGLDRYENKGIVCRPYAIWIDGVRLEEMDIWAEINDVLITGIAFYCGYDDVVSRMDAESFCRDYLVPRRGMILADEEPDKPGAFPETHYLIDDSIPEQKEP
jgi:hypothetical protein